MRNKFADTIYDEAKNNDRICVIVADISPAGSMEKFRNDFPDRFIDCGVSEQSMIGIAAGMAARGFQPFCYTIAPFALYRPFEFIRDDICYQNLPVTIVGMGAGLVYSSLGPTHQATEDIAIASALPNMTVFAPCDPNEVQAITRWCCTEGCRPTYIRLGKAGEPDLTSNLEDDWEFGMPRLLSSIQEDSEVCILTYGTIAKKAIEVSAALKSKGVFVDLISVPTIKPFVHDFFYDLFNGLCRYELVVIIEETNFSYGISSQVMGVVPFGTDLLRYGLEDKYSHNYGSHDELLKDNGLDVEFMVNDIYGYL